MYCKNCGNYMDDNTQFCPNCGAKQEDQAQQAYQQPQQGYQQNYQQAYQQPYQGSAQPAPQVGFLDAVKMFFTRYADFSTRSRRSEFWWAYLGLTIITWVVGMIGGMVDFLGWLPTVWSLAILVPSIAISVRRLHDVGKSGAYYLWILLPIAGPIILLIQYCKDSEGANQYGPSTKY